METFEEWLRSYYVSGSSVEKDGLEEAFDNWLADRDVQQMIDLAEVWHADCAREANRLAANRD